MNSEFFNEILDLGNYAILDGYCKADNVLRRSYTALCSISGGSDSDIVLDIIHHSRCYSEYGMKRTGCVGCPFNKHIDEELAVIEKYEPKLYKAAVNVFGKSYEYTRKYREFAKMMKAKEKENACKDDNTEDN